MRPPEWIKNLLVFAGLLFSQKLNEGPQVVDALITFVAFCAISSAGYLVNDLRDAPLDRRHPEKRHRPIANGELSEGVAAVAAVAAHRLRDRDLVRERLGGRRRARRALRRHHVAYSVILKRLVIIDVMTIASLFILRVVAGAVAVEAHASEWLLLCTGDAGAVPRLHQAPPGGDGRDGICARRLLRFQGAGGDRSCGEADAGPGSPTTRPVLEHYSLPFLDQMVAMVTAGAIISYAIYAVNSPLIGSKMLATAPSVLYGVFRYLYLIYDRNDTRSTAAILTEDPGMIFAGVSWVVIALFMLYVVD